MRENNPSLFNSPVINKIWYVGAGGGETLKPTSPILSNAIDLYIDGEKMDIRDAISITCLNIPYYAGGGLPLGKEKDYFCFSDGQLEVIGFQNLIHYATARVCDEVKRMNGLMNRLE